MLRKGLIAVIFAAMMPLGMFADVFVRTAPPRAVVQTRPPAPGRGFIWTPGYQRWDGRSFVWAPGAWVRPPRAGARWTAARWQRRRGGWVFVGGHWR